MIMSCLLAGLGVAVLLAARLVPRRYLSSLAHWVNAMLYMMLPHAAVPRLTVPSRHYHVALISCHASRVCMLCA